MNTAVFITKLFLSLGLTIFISNSFAQTICIQHGNSTIVESRLDSAVAHAQNGDVIYIPGREMIPPNSNPIYIDKKISLVGCGYDDDSTIVTGQSKINSRLVFLAGADSCNITGIHLINSLEFYSSHIKLIRSNIAGGIIIGGGSSDIFISENIIGGEVNCNNTSTSLTFSKNIFYSSINHITGGVFLNNVFLANSSPISCNCNYCSFINNIFITQPAYWLDNACYYYPNSQPNNNYFQNDLFVADSSTIVNYNNSSIHGYYNNLPNNIFVNFSPNTSWSTTENFHLQPGCIGINNGTDGTDVGIYGTSTPFKAGGVPYNPHYELIGISPVQIQTGTINVNIKVNAQDH